MRLKLILIKYLRLNESAKAKTIFFSVPISLRAYIYQSHNYKVCDSACVGQIKYPNCAALTRF